MDQGYTILPMIAYDEQGREVIDYDHATVESHAIRRAQYDQVQAEQENYVTEFSDGSRQHYYDIDEQGAHFDEGRHTIDEYEDGDEWVDQEDEDYMDPDFAAAVMETVEEHICSYDDYQTVLEWAGDNLDDDEIDYFNAAIDSQDGELILRCIYALVELYNEDDEDPNDY